MPRRFIAIAAFASCLALTGGTAIAQSGLDQYQENAPSAGGGGGGEETAQGGGEAAAPAPPTAPVAAAGEATEDADDAVLALTGLEAPIIALLGAGLATLGFGVRRATRAR
jgi:hypothetical protein